MTTKKLSAFLFTILLLPLIPFILSRGWEMRLKLPSYPAFEDNDGISAATVNLLFKDTGEIKTLTLKEYVMGAAAADATNEGLESSICEALDYALYRRGSEKQPEHNGADICTDPLHCKAFASKEQMRKEWGDGFDEYYAKLETAADMVLGNK